MHKGGGEGEEGLQKCRCGKLKFLRVSLWITRPAGPPSPHPISQVPIVASCSPTPRRANSSLVRDSQKKRRKERTEADRMEGDGKGKGSGRQNEWLCRAPTLPSTRVPHLQHITQLDAVRWPTEDQRCIGQSRVTRKLADGREAGWGGESNERYKRGGCPSMHAKGRPAGGGRGAQGWCPLWASATTPGNATACLVHRWRSKGIKRQHSAVWPADVRHCPVVCDTCVDSVRRAEVGQKKTGNKNQRRGKCVAVLG